MRFARSFYTSDEWRACRAGYLDKVGGLCERCLAKGIITAGDSKHPIEVHHKTRLTPATLADPSVALNWDNLEALCWQCHREEHHPTIRWRCDADGHVEL